MGKRAFGTTLEVLAGVCMVAMSATFGTTAASAQEPGSVIVASVGSDATPSATPAEPAAKPAQKGKLPYYVDFRARTASSYGHAFIWFGKTSDRRVEVAGLHPASDSVVPYILGHVLPVPSETGASYGDLDPQYLTANYRVYLTDAEAKKVFAYIKHKQANTPLWNAAAYNCVSFISDIAQFMGMRVPSSHLLYPEDWVNQMRALNRGRRTANMTAQAQ